MPKIITIDDCKKLVSEDLQKIPQELKNSNGPWKYMIVGIVSCEKSKTRLNNFMNIYGDIFKKLNLSYFIIYADPNIQTAHNRDFSVNMKDRIFTAKAKESYETLAHKLAIFYSYIYNHTNYKYVVKIDDGCLVDLHGISRNLERNYAGSYMTPTSNTVHRGKCTEQIYNKTSLDFGHDFMKYNPKMSKDLYEKLYKIKYAGGGYGYRLSRTAIRCINKYKKHILSLGLSYEDVLFGQILFLEGINVDWHVMGRYHYIDSK